VEEDERIRRRGSEEGGGRREGIKETLQRGGGRERETRVKREREK